MAHLVNSEGDVIKIPEGDSTIGRGPLIMVKDKRVSRNHALLRLNAGKFSICPKHTNPCFYKATGHTSYTILAKDQWKDLHHGDSISLLPGGELDFRIVSMEQPTINLAQEPLTSSSDSSVLHSDPIAPKKAEDDSSHPVPPAMVSDPLDDLFGNLLPSLKYDSRTKEEGDDTMSTVGGEKAELPTLKVESSTAEDITESSEQPVGSESIVADSTLDKISSKPAGSINRERVLPRWLSDIPPTVSSGTNTSKNVPKKKSKTATKRIVRKESPDIDPDLEIPPAKRATSQAEPNRNQVISADKPTVSKKRNMSNKEEETRTASSEDTKNNAKLPLCPYGAKCYRKNPVHFREYSHDFAANYSDSDGEDEANETVKPLCPYGRSCYRKNPAHFAEYTHSLKGRKRRRSNRTTKDKKPSVLAGDSDDDDRPNAYDYEDSFIDDSRGWSDPSSKYASDSEDSEWTPAGKGEEINGDDDDEEENIAELLADANEFIRNKKM